MPQLAQLDHPCTMYLQGIERLQGFEQEKSIVRGVTHKHNHMCSPLATSYNMAAEFYGGEFKNFTYTYIQINTIICPQSIGEHQENLQCGCPTEASKRVNYKNVTKQRLHQGNTAHIQTYTHTYYCNSYNQSTTTKTQAWNYRRRKPLTRCVCDVCAYVCVRALPLVPVIRNHSSPRDILWMFKRARVQNRHHRALNLMQVQLTTHAIQCDTHLRGTFIAVLVLMKQTKEVEQPAAVVLQGFLYPS